MDYLPIFIDVKDQPCLVFGGGEAARGKIDLLLKSNAKVHVVAKNLCDAIAILKEKQFLSHQTELSSMAELKSQKLIPKLPKQKLSPIQTKLMDNSDENRRPYAFP